MSVRAWAIGGAPHPRPTNTHTHALRTRQHTRAPPHARPPMRRVLRGRHPLRSPRHDLVGVQRDCPPPAQPRRHPGPRLCALRLAGGWAGKGAEQGAPLCLRAACMRVCVGGVGGAELLLQVAQLCLLHLPTHSLSRSLCSGTRATSRSTTTPRAPPTPPPPCAVGPELPVAQLCLLRH